MVPLVRTPRHAQALEAPLTAYRAAVAALPGRGEPLIDRLFALECLIHAGRNARPERDKLLPTRRSAEDYIDERWEPDIPHLNVLGQALSTTSALDDDPPPSWIALLDEGLAEQEKRQSRFRLDSDPVVLASVIRGLAATDSRVPGWLFEGVRGYFERSPNALVIAELADALARHRGTDASQLTRQAVEIVFSERHSGDAGVAVARWWLAARLNGLLPDIVTDEKIGGARAQALTESAPAKPRLAAMLAEITGRDLENLVLMTETEVEQEKLKARGRAADENYFWRTAIPAALVVLAIVYLKPELVWLGIANPTARTLAGLATVLTAAASCLVITGTWAILNRRGHDLGLFAVLVSVAFAVIPTVAVLFLYPS